MTSACPVTNARLWPRVRVSWTRVIGGHVRDPLLGRDLLVGVTPGAVHTVLVLNGTASTVAFDSWYAGLALLSMGLLLGIVGHGAVTSLAGKSTRGDLLEYGAAP